MAAALQDLLSAEKALIFRVTHVENLPWILAHGVWCRSANKVDPNFISIGNIELIEMRARRQVPIPPGGTLSDYVPFYFTPRSPMLLNITTGWGGIRQRAREDVVFLVSSLHRLSELGRRFVYSDRHAYLAAATNSSDVEELASLVSFELLRAGDFRRDPEAPDRAERYQAEALVHQHLPCDALSGIACYTEAVKARIETLVAEKGIALPVRVRREWYL
ncbi:MAG TPA: DUF4433 domain-containing protein [Thermoanaerobaculia bacterium]